MFTADLYSHHTKRNITNKCLFQPGATPEEAIVLSDGEEVGKLQVLCHRKSPLKLLPAADFQYVLTICIATCNKCESS